MAYVRTLELDEPDGETGVTGIRHAECSERTDCGGPCIVLSQTDTRTEDDGHECWGCDGWLFKPPLSLEETAALHALREQL